MGAWMGAWMGACVRGWAGGWVDVCVWGIPVTKVEVPRASIQFRPDLNA